MIEYGANRQSQFELDPEFALTPGARDDEKYAIVRLR